MCATQLQSDVRIPYVSGIIKRPRLLERLQAASRHKLTVICAPPGYGKTTIAAQFARQSTIPVAWHAVEERERDVPNLFNQCLAALGAVIPSIKAVTPVPGHTPAELASLVTDFLRDKVEGDIIYVLDDVHHLSGSPAAESWLRTLVDLVPASCHLLLISRLLPALPLTEMIARREVVAIGQELLRFTAEEVHSLVYEARGTSPAMEEVQELASRLEGWPAGTVLALYPLPTDLERAILSGGQGPEALFDMLASSMLHAQPPGLRDFMLAASTLSRITPELCTMALGLQESAYWLSVAQSRNLFLSKISGGLVFHRLFRNFLQNHLRQESPALFAALHSQAAHWFEANGLVDDAFNHYLVVGMVEQAAAIAERVAHTYLAQGKVETLLMWGEALREHSDHVPRLLYTCARVHTDRYHYAEAEADLERAEQGFELWQDTTGLAEVRLQRSMINLQRGNYQLAERQAHRLAQLPDGNANLQGRALRVLGVARLRLGEVEMAAAVLEKALPLHQANGDTYTTSQVLQDLSVAYLRLGRFTEASACLQKVVATHRSLGSAGALALALNNLGYTYHRAGEYERAMMTFQEGLGIVAEVPESRAESYLLWSMGDVLRDLEDYERALQLYDRALELIGDSEPHLRCSILVNASTLRRWQGMLYEAESLAEQALTLARAHDIALETATAQGALWATRAQLGDVQNAQKMLAQTADTLREQGAGFELVHMLALSAHVALQVSDKAAARQMLDSAVKVSEDGGSLQPLVPEVLHSSLLHKFVQDQERRYPQLSSDVQRLRAIQKKSRAQGDLVACDSPLMTYTLDVVTFGEERIERDGRLVQLSDWRATTARELFFFLLFKGPETREQISLEFWPDSSPDKVRSNFHTTLYRARQAVGENAITFRNNTYLIDPYIDLRCDAYEIQSLVKQARLLSPHDARTEDLCRKAVDLYGGDFLPSFDTEWVLFYRETLREFYLEALIGLGECERARSAHREAIMTFRRALDVDPYREDGHRAIMNCYADLGEKSKIKHHLERLRKLLWEDLAIEPSAETMRLANRLLT